MTTSFRRHFLNPHKLQRIAFCRRRFAAASLIQENGLIRFPLTDIGEGITEVELVQWFVEKGSKVQEFDQLCEVMSDKANVNISSPVEGIVAELHYEPGQMANVGQPLLSFWSTNAESTAETQQPSQPPSTAVEATSSPSQVADINEPNSKLQTTPAVRRIAKEHNIDLSLVPATGPRGRILKEDMLLYIKSGGTVSATPRPESSSPTSPPAVSAAPIPVKPSHTQVEDRTVQVSGVQKFMVKKMNEANAVPQFGYGDEVCMDRLIQIRTAMKPVGEKYGIKLSYLPFILKATSLSLSEFPMLNAHANPECSEWIQRGRHNLGVAIDSPQGLVVPNIKDCQNKSVLEIANDLDGLISRVKDGKTTKDDITGGTFSLSNIGAIGGTICRPIVFVPEVMIGALGKTQKIPCYNDKMELVPKSMMHVAWSADHRLIDGATVARFSNRWKQYIEEPDQMLLFLK